MTKEFGDIDLFKIAIARSRIDPPLEDYLRTTGLTEAESREVMALFGEFCSAIENADSVPLPDIATGSDVRTGISVKSAN